jgi:hypothetical protein
VDTNGLFVVVVRYLSRVRGTVYAPLSTTLLSIVSARLLQYLLCALCTSFGQQQWWRHWYPARMPILPRWAGLVTAAATALLHSIGGRTGHNNNNDEDATGAAIYIHEQNHEPHCQGTNSSLGIGSIGQCIGNGWYFDWRNRDHSDLKQQYYYECIGPGWHESWTANDE